LFEPYISYEKEKMGVNEYVAQVVKSPKDLVHAKTIDYSHNALMANFSKVMSFLFRKKEAIKESRHCKAGCFCRLLLLILHLYLANNLLLHDFRQ